MPAVSVVIPVHNRAHLIRRALDSVLNQTFRDLEVIVADDGSDDDLAIAVDSCNDSRVRIVSSPERRGGAAARNMGIESAESELVAFLDSDDEWAHHKLEKQMAALRDAAKCDRPLVLGSRARRNWRPDRQTEPVRWVYQSGADIELSMFGASPWPVRVHWSTMLAPREELNHINGFDPSLPANQWWDLVMRLKDRCDFLLGTEKLLVQYDPEGERIRQTTNIGRAAEILLGKHDMSVPKARTMRSHMLTSSALYRMTLGEYVRPLKLLTSAFVAHPGPRQAARLGGALLGPRIYIALQTHIGRSTTGARAAARRS